MRNRNLIQKFLLLLTLCAVSVVAYSANSTTLPLELMQIIKEKKVTVDATDRALDEIMKIIYQQTKIDYAYQSNANIDKNRKYTLKVKDVTVEVALNALFQRGEYTYNLIDNKILIVNKVINSAVKALVNTKISGKVLDALSGEPIVGATVLIEGTSTGAITDKNGAFSFMGNPAGRLEVSFVGMKNIVYSKLSEKSVDLVLRMEHSGVKMDDVVITGYQTINRNQLSSSVTTISGEDVLQSNATTLDNMLQGKIAGLQVLNATSTPGAATKIRIRGTSTISGNREPLWVVDGIILDDPVAISSEELNSLDNVNLIGNAISGLNPMDIESISILKDASATAIYGVRAANGVIVVSTKKGKLGKPLVSYSGTFGFTERPSYNKLNLMDSRERIDVSKEIETRGLQYSFTPAAIGYEGLLYDLYDRKIDYPQFLNRVKHIEEINTDWFDILYRTSFSQKHNVSVSGANDIVNYYFSGSYVNDKANVKGTGLTQYNGSLKIGVKIRPNLTSTIQLRANITDKDYLSSAVSPYSYAYKTSRAIPAYSEDGSYSYYNAEQGYNSDPLRYNVMNEIDNTGRLVNNSSVNFNANLEWKVIDNLRLTGTFGLNNATTSDKEWFNDKSYEAAKLRRLNYGVAFPDNSTWQEELCKLPYGGRLRNANTNNFGYTARAQADYSKLFDNAHLVTAAAGFELRSSKYSGLTSTQWGYLPERGEKVVVIDPIVWPKFNDLQMATPDVTTNRLSNYVSFYGILTYSYKSKYIFNGNIRADGSNKFGQDKSTRFLPIWSLSGRWNVHNEKFLLGVDWLNELSFKGSYGIQGNVSEDQTPNMIIQLGSIDQTSGEYMSRLSKLPNPFLKWEKTNSYNLALDFSVLNNRISGTVEYYYKQGRDQIVSVEVSGTTGATNMSINAGDIMNKGYELVINAVPIRSRNFSWSLSMNGGKNVNKVTRGGMQSEYTYAQYLNGSAVLKDYAINSFFSYQFDKLNDKGLPLFKNLEANESETKNEVYSRVFDYSGNRIADIEGGFGTTFNYKNFTLGLSFSYSIGAKVRLNNLYSASGQKLPNPQQNMSREFVDRWRQPGDEAWAVVPTLSSDLLTLPSGGNRIAFANNYWQMYNQSDLRVVSGDYLRLRTAYLRYRLSNDVVKKLGIKGASVKVDGNNLWLLASKKLNGQDPEQVAFGGIGNTTPPVSSFSIGIDITF